MDVFGVKDQGSFFWCKARDNGTLRIVAIGATIDHGDESDITAFVQSQMANPVVAPMLVNSDLLWTSSDIISLLIQDPDDVLQPFMRGFLFMAMISGRFRPDHETQALIWADPVTGEKPLFPQVPEQWWVEQDARKETGDPDPDYAAWYTAWLTAVLGG